MDKRNVPGFTPAASNSAVRPLLIKEKSWPPVTTLLRFISKDEREYVRYSVVTLFTLDRSLQEVRGHLSCRLCGNIFQSRTCQPYLRVTLWKRFYVFYHPCSVGSSG